MKETILLVDDEQGIRTVMGLSLRDAGYNVITVASGEEALQLFAERPIPIVITDIRRENWATGGKLWLERTS